MSRRSSCLVLPVLLTLAACGGDEPPPPERETLTLASDGFSVPAGEERYLCWTQTLEKDLRVDRYDYQAKSVIHHLLVSKSLVPVDDGLSECDVLFQSSWVPLFIAGNGDASLEFPEGASFDLPAGTQVVTQLHLLNLESSEVSDTAEITMRVAEASDTKDVGLYSFGTTDINLPAGSSQAVANDCAVDTDVEIFAFLPHMHYLGSRLTLEVGDDASGFQKAYEIDPWDFDDQRIELADLSLPAGTPTRTTCAYENDTADTVTFGDSSYDEMCFLVGFAAGAERALDGCLTLIGDDTQIPVPPDPAAGVCGEHEVNAAGIGAACTKGGGECPSDLTCTADQNDEPDGFCLRIGGCNATPDCGGGWATCCAPPEAGGLINICVPEACRPAECIPQP
ncbi:MAG: hypothetical protein KC731_06095 [Myxococcales bacterium]|nr:hypothetical protein [Myxococcales bacterium]